ncbi:sporulation protein [Hymenobacter sp. J193]|uniref:sporulation protein n=1 Tax=Hymenobacter sp. J193 TaxID=2898429 RepID=UPI0021517784|nr:sporulation protein [Hymenobacter sp. J193]MCR5888625.1 sporulation protein [Hymenobacter sp. J193]
MKLLLLRNVLLLSALISLGACAASAPAVSTAKTSAPDTARQPAIPTLSAEELSRYRPVFNAPKTPAAPPTKAPVAITPTNQVNAQVEQRLRDQAFTNQNVKYAQGFRILAYVGMEREQAMSIRREVISRYPEETDYIAFKQPLYRLWIGDYLTRLEAEAALLRIRPLAPKAELQPAQVVLNKTSF